jgi:aryl-alcohol dehydrogenase-like predicted oxidoreductase
MRSIGYSGDGQAARFTIECGAFDALQTSVSICDQEAIELTLPLARERELGVIAKRPLANAIWRSRQKPKNIYHQPSWERQQKVNNDFLTGRPSPGDFRRASVHAERSGRAHGDRRNYEARPLARKPSALGGRSVARGALRGHPLAVARGRR